MSKIELRCSIAQTQSALKFGSRIGRVTLEIPESELPKAVALIALQETPLKVMVEVDDEYSAEGRIDRPARSADTRVGGRSGGVGSGGIGSS